jgi:hypothetical protein
MIQSPPREVHEVHGLAQVYEQPAYAKLHSIQPISSFPRRRESKNIALSKGTESPANSVIMD